MEQSTSKSQYRIVLREYDTDGILFDLTMEISTVDSRSFDLPLHGQAEKILERDFKKEVSELIQQMSQIAGLVRMAVERYSIALTRSNAFAYKMIEIPAIRIIATALKQIDPEAEIMVYWRSESVDTDPGHPYFDGMYDGNWVPKKITDVGRRADQTRRQKSRRIP